MKIKYFIIACMFTLIFPQEIFSDFYVVNSDTIDTFSYQIPENYTGETGVPLLVAFHQWGGNENSNYSTEFDEEANSRGWLFLSPFGGSANNYNHQAMQSMVESEILWMQEEFNIDKDRIYMVGGSMGGATGAIYANNHLDPTRPMVAATASGSGILDCERRFDEMDGNNSMIEWFGGTPDEVPFTYHRNSAVFFEDSTQSMHTNLQNTPLYLDFGSSEPHRYHAEDLYNLLINSNDNMWIETNPSGGHGYSVMDETHTCDWLEQFELVDNPEFIHIRLDEPSRAYWAEAIGQIDENEFIHFKGQQSNNFVSISEFSNSDTLITHITNSTVEYLHLDNQSDAMVFGIAGLKMELLESIHIANMNADEDWFLENEILWVHFPASTELWVYLDFMDVIFQIDNITIEIGDTAFLPVNYTIINHEFNNDWGGLQIDVQYDSLLTVLDTIIVSEYLPESFYFSNNETSIIGFSFFGETFPNDSLHVFDMGFIGLSAGSTEVCFDNVVISCQSDCWGTAYTNCGSLTVTQSCATGDGNNDGIVDVLDIVTVVNIIINGNNPTETELCHFDMNEDTSINVLDILEMVNIIISE
jgi:pimeloyl-ACP methyl ester carboxylesterase